MLPVVALVGRPNVGKSTLFNRLTRTRDAIVANYAGLTRDRQYGTCRYEEHEFIVIDTGGIGPSEDGVDEVMEGQSFQAIAEADLVLFMLDSREGIAGEDRTLAEFLRKNNKPTLLIANKIDGLHEEVAIAAFYELGLGEVLGISASHGRGIRTLIDNVSNNLPKAEPNKSTTNLLEERTTEDLERGIKIAVIGRPNVGKSTLVNRLLGEDRVVVFDMPGTTRDSIYIDYERHGKHFTLIDTAGVRKRKNIKLAVEKFSIVKTLQAISDANVTVLLVDAQEGLVEQDLHLLGTAIEAGRALVIAINKWDGLDTDQKEYIKRELDRRLRFAEFADIHFISALHGTNVGHLYKSIENSYKSATDKMNTNQLTRILEDAVQVHMPPLAKGRRIKLRYAHAGGHNPPIIVIHGNQIDAIPSHYVRYLEKTFIRALDLHGTPIRIEFKGSENPFAGRKNKLTQRQVNKKRRLMKHTKKQKKK